MPQVVRMPSVMANATDAVLLAWLAEPGASIAVGDPLAEIETDKAVVEYAAEIEGTIGRFLVEPGTRVVVGDPIVVVLEKDEDASALPGGVNPGTGPTPIEAQDSAAPAGRSDRLFATPIARRMAAERGIELAAVTGTGPNGRIVRRDIEGHTPASVEPATTPALPSAAGGYTDVPLTGMRRAIAQRLAESKAKVPHFYVTAHVRVDKLLSVRREVNSSSPRKISVNDFVVKAVGAALAEVPDANVAWNGDSIRHFQSVDVAVAVAVPNGLVTPVVRGVETRGLVELSAEIAQLAEAARSGRLRQEQLEGGSFTVSNLGMYGVDEFSAIINPPHAGILAAGAAKPQPIVGDDGQLAVGTVMALTLSADHRVIDGAIAAKWIAAVVSRLETPIALLL